MEERRKSGLRELRRRLDVTREDIVRVADVSLSTVRNAEIGRPVNERTANQILKAINHWLNKLDQQPITLAELGIDWRQAS